MLPTIEWKPDEVVMIDQRKLPGQEVYVHCKTAAEVARAIKTMVIRGAPAIGVAAGMGIALGMRRSKAQGTKQFAVEFNKLCDLMAATRPTAVNLFWAIARMKRAFSEAVLAGKSVDEVKSLLENEANVNAQDKGGNTPLHRAACTGHEQIVKMLVARKPRINAKNAQGDTPLHNACEGKYKLSKIDTSPIVPVSEQNESISIFLAQGREDTA